MTDSCRLGRWQSGGAFVDTRLVKVVGEGMGWLALLATVFLVTFNFDRILDYMQRLNGQGANVELAYAQRDSDGSGNRSTSSASGFDREVHLRAGRNGHFMANAYVNDREIQVLVDTGASGVALSYEDARAVGILVTEADYTMQSRTANGLTRVAPIMVDHIRIGDIVVRDVQAYVGEPGKLFATLLGMTFLSRLSRVDIRGKELVLVQ